jgi:hypothetical protein
VVTEPKPQPHSERELYLLRDAGVVVDLANNSGWAPNPEIHARDLLNMLMRDEDFEGQPATVKALKKYYLESCRSEGIKPFSWLTVVRPLNEMLKAIYGEKTYRTYRGLHVGNSRAKKKLRVYRIPTLSELEAALAKDQPQVVPLRR